MQLCEDDLERFVYADCIIGSLNLALQLDKRCQAGHGRAVGERSVRLARAVVDATVIFDDLTRTSELYGGMCLFDSWSKETRVLRVSVASR
jgi:hypothetical protein